MILLPSLHTTLLNAQISVMIMQVELACPCLQKVQVGCFLLVVTDAAADMGLGLYLLLGPFGYVC